jgi:hypothetical protein
MSSNQKARRLRPRTLGRAIVEVAFIIFLFYSNLLMGEFTRSSGHGKTFVHALRDVVTPTNLLIAFVTAIIGHVVFDFLRERS